MFHEKNLIGWLFLHEEGSLFLCVDKPTRDVDTLRRVTLRYASRGKPFLINHEANS